VSKRAQQLQQREAELNAALGQPSATAQRPEVLFVRLRRHASVLIPSAALLLVTAFAAGFFIGWFDELWQNLTAAAIAIVVIIAGVLLPFTIWLGNTTTITTRRIIVRRGVLTRTRSEIALVRVREIRSRASVWQRMVRSGTVQLITDAGQQIDLRDVPQASQLIDALHELLERLDAHTAAPRQDAQPSAPLGETRMLTELHEDLQEGW